MRRIYLCKQRFVATAALLLASSLEVCGCDLAPDCEHIRSVAMWETGRADLARRCEACLSAKEMENLMLAQRRLAASAAAALLEEGETVGQAILGGEHLAFYQPGRIPREIVDDPAGASDGLQNAPASSHGWFSGGIFSRFSLRSGVGSQPWPIPESVFFIYKETDAGSFAMHRTPSATAFVVSVPRLKHRGRTRFLVTARHVVDPEWAHCAERNPAAIEVRLNRLTGGSGYEHIPLQAGHVRKFFTPADGTMDIAVIPIDERVIPNIESYKLMDTPFRLLPTAPELAAIRRELQDGGSSPSREIVTASVRTQPAFEEPIYPVSDSGLLSSTAAAPVEIQCGAASNSTTLRLWTVDAAVPQEVSGAPVYTTMIRSAENIESPVLLGVQSVAWPGRPVAGITPADALVELIQKALGRDVRQMDLYRGPLP